MRPRIEEGEERPFLCGEADSEEEKVWVAPRVPQETILCQEGLVIFELFDWRTGGSRKQILEGTHGDTQ